MGFMISGIADWIKKPSNQALMASVAGSAINVIDAFVPIPGFATNAARKALGMAQDNAVRRAKEERALAKRLEQNARKAEAKARESQRRADIRKADEARRLANEINKAARKTEAEAARFVEEVSRKMEAAARKAKGVAKEKRKAVKAKKAKGETLTAEESWIEKTADIDWEAQQKTVDEAIRASGIWLPPGTY